MTLRRALARSVNSITAQLTDMVGPDRVVEYAHKLGYHQQTGCRTVIGLGSSDVSLYELVSSYCTFVNEGQYTKPILVQRIEDRNGTQIEEFKQERRPAISPESAYLMLYMLQGGLQERGGTSQSLWSFDLFKHNHQMGAKTGHNSRTTRTAGLLGVSDKLVVGAWVVAMIAAFTSVY
jgi:penicillin-binding protein 1A